MTTPKPSRRRLTQAEWEKALNQSRASGDWRDEAKVHLDRLQSDVETFITRTGRRRSWWQRGWKR